MMTNANIAKIDEVGSDRVPQAELPRRRTVRFLFPASAAIVAFDKTTPDQLAPGRMVFVIIKKDSTDEAAAVVIGAEGVKGPPPM